MFFGSELIKNKVEFSSLNGPQSLDIAYGADDKFMFGAGVSIESVIINNPDRKICFHIFTDDISEENAEKLSKICRKHQTAINIYKVNAELVKNLPTNRAWSHAIYFRLMIADYFYAKVDKVLYLDADVFCHGSLDYLIDLDLSSHTLAAVSDPSAEDIIQSHTNSQSELKFNGYFNSGVMLINTKMWYEKNITQQAMAILSDKKESAKLKYFDQDAINAATSGSVLFVENKYNFIIDLNFKYKCHNNLSDKNVSLFHFVGLTKPWHIWADNYDECLPFKRAKISSPWQYEPLLSPKTRLNYKYAAKHEKFNKKYFSSLRSYIMFKILSKLS